MQNFCDLCGRTALLPTHKVRTRAVLFTAHVETVKTQAPCFSDSPRIRLRKAKSTLLFFTLPRGKPFTRDTRANGTHTRAHTTNTTNAEEGTGRGRFFSGAKCCWHKPARTPLWHHSRSHCERRAFNPTPKERLTAQKKQRAASRGGLPGCVLGAYFALRKQNACQAPACGSGRFCSSSEHTFGCAVGRQRRRTRRARVR